MASDENQESPTHLYRSASTHRKTLQLQDFPDEIVEDDNGESSQEITFFHPRNETVTEDENGGNMDSDMNLLPPFLFYSDENVKLATRERAWQIVINIKNFLVETVMEYIIKEIREITLLKIFKWMCSTLMIFGGVMPFIPQYREIKKKGDAEGFSLYVCLVLIFANTLRILFWFGKRYELPLLVQSFVMNITMIVMIHVCVTVRHKSQLMRGTEHTFTDFDYRYFWQWTDFMSYMDFIILMSLTCSLITFLCMRFPIFVETLGFLALFSEAMLAVPQLLKNFKLQSTQGMSVLMVLMWMVGDVFKTSYFVLRDAPAQFWICGGLQVTIDVFILYQVYLYKDNLGIGLPSHSGLFQFYFCHKNLLSHPNVNRKL